MIELIGVIVTILFGIPSLIALRRVYSTSVSFCEVGKINLHDEVTKNIDQLKITYKQQEIGEHLFLYKGLFFCSGKRDITKQDILENIKIQIPENSFWLECNIVASSDDFRPKEQVDKHAVKFDFELFKHGEYFYIEGLFESPESKGEKNKLDIKHRIANLGKIEQLNYIELIEFPKEIMSKLFASVTLLVMFFYMFANLSFATLEFVKSDGSELNNEINFIAEYDAIDSINAEYSYFDLLPSNLTREFSYKDISTNEEVSFKGKLKKGSGYYLGFLFLISATILLLFCFMTLLKYLRNRRLIDIVSKINGKLTDANMR